MKALKEIRIFHLVIAFLLGSLVVWSAGNLSGFSGQGLLRGTVKIDSGNVCNGEWETVFAGTYDQDGPMNVGVDISEDEMANLVDNGCEFRVTTVAKADRGDWVDKFSKTYECAIARYQNAVNGFTCLSATYSDGVGAIGESVTLDFVGNEVLHRGLNNNAPGETVYIQVMVK